MVTLCLDDFLLELDCNTDGTASLGSKVLCIVFVLSICIVAV